MKRIVFVLLLLFSVSLLSAQQIARDTLSRKEISKRKKEAREAERQKQFETIYQMLLSRSFVLEADFIENYMGRRISVKSNLNFMLVDSANAVLQGGADYGVGYNGVGGATIRGEVLSYKLSRNEKQKSCSLYLNVNSISGNYTISVEIPASDYASARVSGMRSGRFVYVGHIIPLKESSVYIGRSL
jgi:hypothetical protein